MGYRSSNILAPLVLCLCLAGTTAYSGSRDRENDYSNVIKDQGTHRTGLDNAKGDLDKREAGLDEKEKHGSCPNCKKERDQLKADKGKHAKQEAQHEANQAGEESVAEYFRQAKEGPDSSSSQSKSLGSGQTPSSYSKDFASTPPQSATSFPGQSQPSYSSPSASNSSFPSSSPSSSSPSSTAPSFSSPSSQSPSSQPSSPSQGVSSSQFADATQVGPNNQAMQQLSSSSTASPTHATTTTSDSGFPSTTSTSDAFSTGWASEPASSTSSSSSTGWASEPASSTSSSSSTGWASEPASSTSSSSSGGWASEENSSIPSTSTGSVRGATGPSGTGSTAPPSSEVAASQVETIYPSSNASSTSADSASTGHARGFSSDSNPTFGQADPSLIEQSGTDYWNINAGNARTEVSGRGVVSSQPGGVEQKLTNSPANSNNAQVRPVERSFLSAQDRQMLNAATQGRGIASTQSNKAPIKANTQAFEPKQAGAKLINFVKNSSTRGGSARGITKNAQRLPESKSFRNVIVNDGIRNLNGLQEFEARHPFVAKNGRVVEHDAVWLRKSWYPAKATQSAANGKPVYRAGWFDDNTGKVRDCRNGVCFH